MYSRFNDIDVNKVYKTIMDSTDILILTHVQPDGDSIGCTSAMYTFCKRINNKANIVYGGINDIPKSLSFLTNVDKYQILTDIPEEFLYNDNGLILCLDTSEPARCIPNYENHINKDIKNIINIDHHPNNTSFGTIINLVQINSASCSELIASIIMQSAELNHITPVMKNSEAYDLYTGVKTDTGNFKYSSVTKNTMLSAACISQYLEPGDIVDIEEKIIKTKPVDYPLVYSRILNDMIYYNNHEVAIMSCRKKHMDGTDVSIEDIKSIVNFPFEVVPVRMTILITEAEKDSIFNVAVRSRPPYNAKNLATKLGGGGHEAASGAIVNGKTYNEVFNMIVKEVELM